MGYNLKKLNILVRNEEESNFVLNLAWKAGYMWRDKDYMSNENELSRHQYREGCSSEGEFIYSFDYNDEQENCVLSCFSGEQVEFANIKETIEFYELEIIEARDMMSMDQDALEVFLRLR
jgi:hypothetical protein